MKYLVSHIGFAFYIFLFSFTVSGISFGAEITAAQRAQAAEIIKDSPEKEFWTMFSMLASPDQNMAATKGSDAYKFYSKLMSYNLVTPVPLEEHLKQAYDGIFLFFQIPARSQRPIIAIFKEAQPQNIERIDQIVEYQLKLEGNE